MNKKLLFIDLIESLNQEFYKTYAKIINARQGKISKNLLWFFLDKSQHLQFLFGDADEKNIHEITNAIEQDILPKHWICKTENQQSTSENLLKFHGFKQESILHGLLLDVTKIEIKKQNLENEKILDLKDLNEFSNFMNTNFFSDEKLETATFEQFFNLNTIFKVYAKLVKSQIENICICFQYEDITGLFLFDKNETKISETLLNKIIVDAKISKQKYITTICNNNNLAIFEQVKFIKQVNFKSFKYSES